MSLSCDSAHGRHVFCDYTGFFGDALDGGKFVFESMKESLKLSTLREVHSHLEILGNDSEPGFTSVILVDESHLTSHCYADRGLLALDIFTCGKNDPELMMRFIDERIREKYPSIKRVNLQEHSRFFV